MKRGNNIMKGIIFVLFIFILFFSCKNRKTNNYFPIEKILIIEYRYLNIEDKWMFQLVGFSEMDKNFNLKSAIFSYDGFYYCNSNIVIPNNSVRDRISKTILKYPIDTAFLYTKGTRIYDGNSYQFVIEKNNEEKTVIRFEPEFLPSDLLFLYEYLYEDRKGSLKKDSCEDMFRKFEEQVKSEFSFFLPPILRDTIQFLPPIVVPDE